MACREAASLDREAHGAGAATAALEYDPHERIGVAGGKIEGRREDVGVVPVVSSPDISRDHSLEEDGAVAIVDQRGGPPQPQSVPTWKVCSPSAPTRTLVSIKRL